MTSTEIRVVEFWSNSEKSSKWVRVPELEGYFQRSPTRLGATIIFEEAEWKINTVFLSSVTEISMHPTY